MTDRLQQKAEQIVRERKNCTVYFGGQRDKRAFTSEELREVYSDDYQCALAGLTAGIAMAAPTPEPVLVGKMRTFAEECLRRIAATPSCAGDDLHTKDTYEDILKLCALAKGETQHG